MNPYLKIAATFGAFVICASIVAFAQQKVNQGQPGTQGPWPVTGTTTLADGGTAYLQTTLTGVVDDGNSSTAPLGIAGVFTGTWREVKDYSVVTVSTIADRASATNGVSLQWGSDGTTATRVETVSVAANAGRAWALNVRARYFRVVYTNNAAIAQTSFKLSTVLHASGNGMNNYPINQVITADSFSVLTRAVITGANPADGGFVNVAVHADGDLLVQLATPTFPADGGFAGNTSVAFTAPYACGATTQQTVYVTDGGVGLLVGSLSSRVYTVVCNSKDNSSGVIRCRADGTVAIIDAGSPGTVLGVGDCVPYTNPAGNLIYCAGPVGQYVASYE